MPENLESRDSHGASLDGLAFAATRPILLTPMRYVESRAASSFDSAADLSVLKEDPPKVAATLRPVWGVA